MLQTFSKTINGHNLEFNRLLYPVRYIVTSHEEKHQGNKVEIVHENETWCVSRKVDIPDCFYKILDEICDVVKKNEMRETSSMY